MAGLPDLQDRVEVVWAADPEPAQAEAIARLTGARPLDKYREGLDEIDAVCMLVPHHLHHQIAVDCLAAGCHVLLEKPIARTLEEADAIIASATQAQHTLMVAYPHRYRRSMRLFKDAVLGGDNGSLLMLDAMMDESIQSYANNWMAQKETLGGGVFFSASPHMLYPIFWIAGEVQSLSMVGTRTGKQIEGEDRAASIIKFKNGIIGVTRHTWASPRPRIWYTLNALCSKAQITLTTQPLGDLGSKGPDCRWNTQIVALDQTGEETILHQSSEGLDLKPEILHFLDCLDTGQTPETDGPTTRKIVELTQTAYRQAEKVGANT